MLDPKSSGAIGEKVVEKWLKERKYFVLPATAIENGGAPMLEGDVERVIVPDFQISKEGATAWVDVKTKARAPKFQKHQAWKTGCELRHFHAYQKVSKITGLPGMLAFIHFDIKSLHLGALEWIDSDSQIWRWTKEWAAEHPGHPYKEDMIFFHLARFDQFDLRCDSLFQMLGKAIVEPKIVRPWEVNKKPPQAKQGFLF